MTTFEEQATYGKYKGKTLLEQAKAEGYKIVTNADELQSVAKQIRKLLY